MKSETDPVKRIETWLQGDTGRRDATLFWCGEQDGYLFTLRVNGTAKTIGYGTTLPEAMENAWKAWERL